jgi:quinol monooxygenase YgiN
MISLLVKFRIAPEKREAFAALIDRQAKNSATLEPGCKYFDVCQDEKDPNLFVLYEIYTDDKALDAHRTYPHYKEFQAAITGMIQEREIVRLKRRESLR